MLAEGCVLHHVCILSSCPPFLTAHSAPARGASQRSQEWPRPPPPAHPAGPPPPLHRPHQHPSYIDAPPSLHASQQLPPLLPRLQLLTAFQNPRNCPPPDGAPPRPRRCHYWATMLSIDHRSTMLSIDQSQGWSLRGIPPGLTRWPQGAGAM